MLIIHYFKSEVTQLMKIVITARNFSTSDTRAVNLLRDSGYEIVDYSSKNLGPGTTETEMAKLVGDADILIAGLEPIGETVMNHCPKLKMVSKRAIGYDSVNLEQCREHQIAVARATGTVEAAVAEHVMAYILYFARHIERQNDSMHKGQWNRVMMPGAKNRTLGLVGFGGIGKEIAKRAVPFGMNVLYYCRHPKAEWEQEYHVRFCELDELLAVSDYVSVNVSLSDSTKGMFSESLFRLMKSDSVFINIARGQVVDTPALKKALDNHWIRGAAVDAFDSEPCIDSPLLSCENAILTPHTAPFTSENFSEMNMRAAQNVIDYFENRLDPIYQLV